MPKSRYGREKRDPELANCRTSRVGAVIPGTTLEMFYCRLDNEECRYSMPIGYDFVCKHSNNHAFTTPDIF